MIRDITIEPLAEDALLLRFGDAIDRATNSRVHAAARAIHAAGLPGVMDIAPAYASLLVRIDPADAAAGCAFERIATALISFTTDTAVVGGKCLPPLPQADSSLGGEGRGEGASASISRVSLESPDMAPDSDQGRPVLSASKDRDDEQRPGVARAPRAIEIQVCYGGESGPDLDAIAAQTGLSSEAIIALHAGAEYTVAMLGFAPGFPYLLGLDPALHVPRRATPRTHVPAGSVAIGGAQTGIYPRELPGGWNLIGRTPRMLFDPRHEPPALFAPGDRVRFRPIDADEFATLAAHT